MTTNRQRCFFPEDEAKRPRQYGYSPTVRQVRCVDGPKDGEYIATSDPPNQYLLVTQLMGLQVYSYGERPSLRPPLCVHEYQLQKWITISDSSVTYTYEYQGIR